MLENKNIILHYKIQLLYYNKHINEIFLKIAMLFVVDFENLQLNFSLFFYFKIYYTQKNQCIYNN